ncbi:XdhC family protein [Thermogymnomonas acidicola]|uniref:XdhC family protein n=1 Tax=Thermogymnomonas acidicola TaxID=399579 RepID=UPI0009467551|nr:XdhC family protein [Thermogymnomonas acidicola]
MDSAEFAGILSDMVKRGGDRFVVATVVATSGSSIAKPGFKEIISESGEIVWGGTLGGACPESVIIDESLSVLRKGGSLKQSGYTWRRLRPLSRPC